MCANGGAKPSTSLWGECIDLLTRNSWSVDTFSGKATEYVSSVIVNCFLSCSTLFVAASILLGNFVQLNSDTSFLLSISLRMLLLRSLVKNERVVVRQLKWQGPAIVAADSRSFSGFSFSSTFFHFFKGKSEKSMTWSSRYFFRNFDSIGSESR